MTSFRRDTITTLAIVTAIAFAAGCRTNPERASRGYIARGDRYVAQNKLPEAIIEYRTAIKTFPRSGEAHYKLAEASIANDDVRAAFSEYLRAADLLPDREDVQLKAGNLQLVAGRFVDAKARARAVLQRNPRSAGAMILLGNALAGMNDLDTAVAVSQRAAALDPGRSGFYQNVGVLELARGNRDLAEASFKHALDVDPKSISASLALAQLYRTTDRPREAEEWIRRALSIDPGSVRANQLMASHYIETGRIPEAERFLKTVADRSTDLDSKLTLADYYLAVGRAADAITILQALQSARDSYAVATTRLAIVEFASGHGDRAHKLVDDVLAKDAKNSAALVVKTRLQLADRDLTAALATAGNAIAADPRSAAPQIVLGKVLMASLQVDAARKAFREALNIDPRSAEAQVELARLHLLRGEPGSAIEYAEGGVKTQPNSLAAGLTLARSLIMRPDDHPRAEAQLKALATKFPRAPQVSDAAASLALARKDLAGARRAWEHALQLDPKDIDALSGLSGLLLSAKMPADARSLVDKRLAEAPADPNVLLLSAKLHLIARRDADAEAQLKRVVEVDPANLQAYSLLGQLYVSQHRLADAKREFETLAAREPQAITGYTMVGLICEQQSDEKCAIDWYQRALRINNRAASAANNLAAIYADRDTNLDVALQLAESAVAELPKVPEVNDTLGWVYYKKQLNALALRALTRSVELDPSNPVHQYHLGLAYVQAGDDASARKALEEALRLKQDFRGADDARKVLATLVY